MEKSKLGISVGLLAALLYFLGLLSGYLVTVLVAGYILVAESNLWLRKSAVKAVENFLPSVCESPKYTTFKSFEGSITLSYP